MRLAALALALAICTSALGQGMRLVAPNVVVISPTLVTSGQPSASALADLKAQGFDAVIYLAPANVSDAVRDEQLIVTRQGLAFINLPISFENPTEVDFDLFSSLLQGLGTRKALVHCQVNMRASSMVFLYRVIVQKEDPRIAYEAVSGVWVPHGPWRRLIETQLRKHNVPFEIL